MVGRRETVTNKRRPSRKGRVDSRLEKGKLDDGRRRRRRRIEMIGYDMIREMG